MSARSFYECNLERIARISAIFEEHYDNEGSDPTDLLADLMHWCSSASNETGQPFADHLDLAHMHYEAEQRGE